LKIVIVSNRVAVAYIHWLRIWPNTLFAHTRAYRTVSIHTCERNHNGYLTATC